MKNLSYLIISLFICIASSVYSQEFNLRTAEYEKKNKKFELKGLIQEDSTGYYIYQKEYDQTYSLSNEIILTKYNLDLEIVFDKELKLPEKELKSIDLISLNNRIYWLNSEYDYINKIKHFYAAVITDEGVMLDNTLLGSYDFPNNKLDPFLHYRVENEKLVFLVDYDTKKKDNKSYSEVKVFDANLDEVWNNTINYNVDNRHLEISQLKLLNNEVYYISNEYDKGTKYISHKDARYQTIIYKVSSKEVNKVLLDSNEHLLKSTKFEFFESRNEIVSVSLYTSDNYKPLLGISYASINLENFTLKSFLKRPFTKEAIEMIGTKSIDENRKTDEVGYSSNFRITEIQEIPDEGFSIFMDEYKLDNSSSFDSNRSKLYLKIHHIIKFDFDFKGNILSSNIIPMRFITACVASGQSFIVPLRNEVVYSKVNIDGKQFFLYNDDHKNIENEITEIDDYGYANIFNSVVLYSTFGENGEIIRKELFNQEDSGYRIIAEYSRQISSNEIFLFLLNKKKPAKKLYGVGILTVK